jgi:hypothetical protein
MREPKIYSLLPNLCDIHTKIHRLAYRFSNLEKIYRLAYGFFFFVISTSGLNPLPLALIMYLPASKALHTGPYKS